MTPEHVDPEVFAKQLTEAYEAQMIAAALEADTKGDPKLQAMIPIMARCQKHTIPIFIEMVQARNGQLDPNIIATVIVTLCTDMLTNCVVNMGSDIEDRERWVANMLRGIHHNITHQLHAMPTFRTPINKGGNA